MANAFIHAGVLKTRGYLDGGREIVVVSDGLIQEWDRLSGWINEDVQFLLWRQKLESWVREWEQEKKSVDFLLRGGRLRTATDYAREHAAGLSNREKRYIRESLNTDRLSEKSWFKRLGVVLSIILLISALYGYDIWNRSREYKRTQASQAALLTAQGVNSFRNNDLDSALTLFNTALNLDPAYGEAFYARADIYTRRKDYDKALEDINYALRQEPDNVKFRLKRGETLLAAGKNEEALKDLNALITKRETIDSIIQNSNSNSRAPIDTDFVKQFDALRPQVYYVRGNILSALGNYGSAVGDYTKAIDVKPNYRDAFNKRGQAYAQLGNSAQAEADRAKAASILDPET